MLITGTGGVAMGAARQAADGPTPSASASSSAPHLTYFGPMPRIEVGGKVWFTLDGAPAGTDEVTVSSPALVKPIALTLEKKDGTRFVQNGGSADDHQVRDDVSPGTYPVTATSHGHTLATASLALAAKGSADIGRFVIGPRGAFPGSDTSAAVHPGAEVTVVLTDHQPDPDEDSLTVKSPAFEHPLTLKQGADDPGCKCDDGSTLYGGHTRLRDDLKSGRYPMTVVSHHGKQTTTRQFQVTGEPVADDGPGPWTIGGIVAAVLVVLAAAGLAVRRRRKAAAS
ncbi:hypothetical protein [Streptomyces orinoci]|uniref:Uncharacterized protein n=1 Tax=Streptomyces orinoci TaxID=67339 RepID=A0ABV3K4W9_STRON|nr:hypothetical protein [Streptomyces orinoci]